MSEAKAKLDKAYSDPSLSKTERVKLVQEGARTLKTYGEPTSFPPRGGMPLEQNLQGAYNKAMKEAKALNQLRQAYSDAVFKGKMKFINDMQIDVVGNQISFLIPGQPIADLSMETIKKVFGWDFAQGFNAGDRGNAKGLAGKFKNLENLKDTAKRCEDAFNTMEEEVKNWKKTVDDFKTLEGDLEKEFDKTAASTTTLKELRDDYKDKKDKDGKDKKDEKDEKDDKDKPQPPPKKEGEDEGGDDKDKPQDSGTTSSTGTSSNESKSTTVEKGAVWDKKGNKITLTEETDKDGNKKVIYTTTKDGKVIDTKVYTDHDAQDELKKIAKDAAKQASRDAARTTARPPRGFSGGGGGGGRPGGCTCPR
ncbi:MAG: hypothetical protein ACOY3I_07520 [Verrucomicrobiota bacterium]